jgi:hypothetical protein
MELVATASMVVLAFARNVRLPMLPKKGSARGLTFTVFCDEAFEIIFVIKDCIDESARFCCLFGGRVGGCCLCSTTRRSIL